MNAWINGIGWLTPAGLGKGRTAAEQPLVAGELEIPTRKQIFTEIDRRFGRSMIFRVSGWRRWPFVCGMPLPKTGRKNVRSASLPPAATAAWRPISLYLETMLPEGGKLASPNLFAYTLAEQLSSVKRRCVSG